MNGATKNISRGYAVFKLRTDPFGIQEPPIGVAVWDVEQDWHVLRLADPHEKITGLKRQDIAALALISGQIKHWASSRMVPYAKESTKPSTPDFWQAVSNVMTTSVTLDPPRAMETLSDPDVDVENLFEAIVQPKRTGKERTQRIGTAIKKALGKDLASRLPSRIEVNAFGGAHEIMPRSLVTSKRAVFIDGVNLAASDARKDADALVSRIQRVLFAYPDVQTRVIIGYCSSPGGLNGEAHMKDWIERSLTDKVFDLSQEQTKFKEAVSSAYHDLEELEFDTPDE